MNSKVAFKLLTSSSVILILCLLVLVDHIDGFVLFSVFFKVYSCASESVISEFVPFSTPRFRFYQHKNPPDHLYLPLSEHLNALKAKVCILAPKLSIFIIIGM